MKGFLTTLVVFGAAACQVFSAAGTPPDTPAASARIDQILARAWQARGLQGNPPAGDQTFVRRIYLDVVGRIPTHRETTEFLASTDQDKRAKLIDRLLSGEGYVQHQFNYWADILRVLGKGTYQGNAGLVTGTAYVKYVKDSLRTNKPYDQFVRELLAAEGAAWNNGAVGYYQRDRGMPLDNLAIATRIFLGTRIECAQCHNHPFDQWTQMQFYQLAAFTYGMQTTFGHYSRVFESALTLQGKNRLAAGGRAEDEVHLRQAINELIIPIKHGTVRFREQGLHLPHDYAYDDAKPKAVVKPNVLMGAAAAAPATGQGGSLKVFADWVTSPQNPRFTRLIVNRLWKKVFGLGLSEPVDQMIDGVPPMNPELLAYLENLMVGLDYDLKACLRILYNTSAYQREVTAKELAAGEVYHFTGPLLRRMSAEQMWDSLVTLMNAAPDLPALEIRDAGERLLTSARKLGDAIENLTPAELLQRVHDTAGIFKDHAVEIAGLQVQMAAARMNEDKTLIKELGRKVGLLRQSEMSTADENIFVPAVLKLAAKSGSLGAVSEEAAPAPSGIHYKFEDIRISGYDHDDLVLARRQDERASQLKVIAADAEAGLIPQEQRAPYLRFRQAIARTVPRAADVGSPAPAGHPLREFGQSDRDTVENANQDASIPQALVLMNGTVMAQVLSPFSQVKRAVFKAAGDDQKMEAVYLTLLSRRPTADEKQRWNTARKQGLVQPDDLIFALLNTHQFIFIQ